MATRQTPAVATTTQTTEIVDTLNPFRSKIEFETAQRMAALFAQSPMVPDTYKGNIGSCVIALDMANRMGAAPLMVMQNLYIVHGIPSWSSKFLVACFNKSGRFAPITYETNVNKEKDPNKWYCVAHSVILATGETIESDKITWQMVNAEGWNKKNGSKWLTMPGQMFRYRAASFLIRAHAPEISFGFYTEEEAFDGATAPVDVPFEDMNEEPAPEVLAQIQQAAVVETPVAPAPQMQPQPIPVAQPQPQQMAQPQQMKENLFNGVKL